MCVKRTKCLSATLTTAEYSGPLTEMIALAAASCRRCGPCASIRWRRREREGCVAGTPALSTGVAAAHARCTREARGS